MQFAKSTAEVQNSTFVILFNFCAKFELTFFKAVPSASCRTLAVIVEKRTPKND